MSSDGLELYFTSDRPAAGLDTWNLWVVTRQTQEDDWGEPVPLGPEINSTFEDDWPHLSPDGLELYFCSFRPDGYGMLDTWVTRRSTRGAPWGPAVNLGLPVNSADHHEYSASITADGLELFLSRETRTGSPDLWSAKRATRDAPWGEPASLGSLVNTPVSDCLSSISADGLVLCFSSHPAHTVRPGGYGGPDIWVTTRPTRTAPWGPPWNPGPPLNTASSESCPSISADGRWLYFSDFWWHSTQEVRPGGYGSDDLWKARIIPIVDFNGDGLVEIGDLVLLIENWGKSEPRCDVGPMPWGDGIVDEADLRVLMSSWNQEAYDPTLLAHWKLDEASGLIATDSAGGNDATVMGNPAWQAAGGKIGGALLLDGVDDCLRTGYVLNPPAGPFSAFAWVKGGAPGQVILSQVGAANWLMVGTPEGALATELKGTSRDGKPLASAAAITDGAWHRVGLVWDGRNRILYVDGIEVAKDGQTALAPSAGGLYIGAGSKLTAGTFWKGLIDDIRIYNRAVKP